jgi:alpha-tubulin suppressor-like RCC1 family protein
MPKTLPATLGIGAVSLALGACSLLVGDGDYSVGGRPDAGTNADADGHTEAHVEAGTGTGIVARSVSSGPALQTWCAVDAKGDVYCWGDNTFGQLGNGSVSITAMTVPRRVSGLPGPVSDVAVGAGVVCALVQGSVYCWGNAEFGQLGNGKVTGTQNEPEKVPDLGSDVIAIAAGFVGVCAVRQEGTVWCWGVPVVAFGQGSFTPSPQPIEVEGIDAALSVSVGEDTACAVLKGGAVKCWGGYFEQGTLGNGQYAGSATPVPASGLGTGVTRVSVGATAACAITSQQDVKCWGQGAAGQLGENYLTGSADPVLIAGLPPEAAETIAVGLDSVCAGTNDAVWCWGDAEQGELGNGTSGLAGTSAGQSNSPVKVKELSGNPISLCIGDDTPCAVTADGGVECWGFTGENARVPVAVMNDLEGMTGAVAVSVGSGLPFDEFACGIITTTDVLHSTVQCWGSNLQEQLGNNSTEILSSVPVTTLSPQLQAAASSVAAGQGFACGVGEGIAQCWGQGGSGQLGNGMAASSANPQPVSLPMGGSSDSVEAVAAGGYGACALTKAGAVYCWGANDVGQLGLGNAGGAQPTPSLVSALPSAATAIAVGYNFACALLAGGTMDCWGDNSMGELGNDSFVASYTPQAVPGLSGVTYIAAGLDFVCAVTGTEGHIQCWGDGVSCQLGDGLCSSTGTPVTVTYGTGATVTGASAVSAGVLTTCAIVKGAAYCWGLTAIGSAVDPLRENPFPTPVAGLSSGVTSLAVGLDTACAVVDNAIQCWGFNGFGQLGNGGPLDDFVATPIPGFN